MRFVGLVMVLSGVAIAYFLGFKGTGNVPADTANARNRLAQLLNLPGLKSPSPAAAGSTPAAGGGGS